MALAVGIAAVLAGAFVQSASGFGFAMLVAPVLTATLGPHLAIPTVTLAGIVVSLLTLTTERRRLTVVRPAADVLVATSVPGMVAGALLLVYAPTDLLRVLVSLAVLAAVGVQRFGRGPRAEARRPGWIAAALAGVTSGALATSVGLSGPPLVLYLLGRRVGPLSMRDTLAAVFLVTGVLTVAALAAFGAFVLPATAGLLCLSAAIGQALGRLALGPLRPHHHAVLLGMLCVSAVAGLVPALQALL